MTASAATHPPLLVQQHPRTTPTFESFLYPSAGGISDPSPTDHAEALDIIDRQVQAGEDYNRYAFAQYVVSLYVEIFVTPDTSQIIRSALQATRREIVGAVSDRRVTDRDFREFINTFLKTTPAPRGRAFVDALRRLRVRLDMDGAYPRLADLFAIVAAMHDDRPAVIERVELYEIALTDLAGYDTPTLRLIPMSRVVPLDTSRFAAVPDLGWKFIYSLDMPARVETNRDLLGYLYTLARLALPLDPIALTTSLRGNTVANRKTGVPFLNYLAMCLRQRALGTDYTLPRLADSLRVLAYRMHSFCGVGATCVSDAAHLRPLLAMIAEALDRGGSDAEEGSDEARALLSRLESACREGQTISFIRSLSHDEATEAAKLVDPDEPDDPDDPDEPSKPKKTKKTPPADPDADPPADPPDPDDHATQSNNDTIDRQADQGSESGTRPVSKLVPLALPTETFDDHLYRLAVLSFVSNLITTPDPSVSNDAIGLLKAWCGTLLFIASSETTRSLITQLKLTGKLKEFHK